MIKLNDVYSVYVGLRNIHSYACRCDQFYFSHFNVYLLDEMLVMYLGFFNLWRRLMTFLNRTHTHEAVEGHANFSSSPRDYFNAKITFHSN